MSCLSRISEGMRTFDAARPAAADAAFDAARPAALDAAFEAALPAAFEAAFDAALLAEFAAALDAALPAALEAALEAAFEAGVNRIVLGTALVSRPEWVAELCARYRERVVAGIDARKGQVALVAVRNMRGEVVSVQWFDPPRDVVSVPELTDVDAPGAPPDVSR